MDRFFMPYVEYFILETLPLATFKNQHSGQETGQNKDAKKNL